MGSHTRPRLRLRWRARVVGMGFREGMVAARGGFQGDRYLGLRFRLRRFAPTQAVMGRAFSALHCVR